LEGKEELAIELAGWMLSGQEGSITYICIDEEEAKRVYDCAVDILKGILLKIKWEGIGEDIN